MADISAIYVAAPEPETGKSTVALGLLHRLTATVAKVGVFRPITRDGQDRDYILELLLSRTTAGLSYQQCVGVTYQQLHADGDAAIATIVDAYHAMAELCDVVVIVGSDYSELGQAIRPAELSTNARIAVNLGAPILLTVSGKGRTAAEVATVVQVCLAELDAQHAHTAAVVVNRCEPAELDAVAEALRGFPQRCYVLPDEPLLSAPTVAELEKAVAGSPVSGEESLREREVTGILVAGMTADHVLERLADGMAV
ncbi:AAA family ATPase, partial [Mycobacterium avium]